MSAGGTVEILYDAHPLTGEIKRGLEMEKGGEKGASKGNGKWRDEKKVGDFSLGPHYRVKDEYERQTVAVSVVLL